MLKKRIQTCLQQPSTTVILNFQKEICKNDPLSLRFCTSQLVLNLPMKTNKQEVLPKIHPKMPESQHYPLLSFPNDRQN